MYTYQERIIRAGRSWTDANGVKHPANWTRWTDAEKTAMGLVWQDDPAPYDNRFYWDANTPKALDDVTETDEGGNEVVIKGLKSQAIEQVKQTAGSLLASTDWYVTRKAETDAEIPADVLAYREAVRVASNTIESKIKAVKSHTGFMKLYDAPVDSEGNPTGNAPINDWPESV